METAKTKERHPNYLVVYVGLLILTGLEVLISWPAGPGQQPRADPGDHVAVQGAARRPVLYAPQGRLTVVRRACFVFRAPCSASGSSARSSSDEIYSYGELTRGPVARPGRCEASLVCSLTRLFKLRVVGLLVFAAMAGAFVGAHGWPGVGATAALVPRGRTGVDRARRPSTSTWSASRTRGWRARRTGRWSPARSPRRRGCGCWARR